MDLEGMRCPLSPSLPRQGGGRPRPLAQRRTTPSAPSGFSLIEALIAAAILLIIALGVLPLFTQSMLNNTVGNDATQTSNQGKTRLESFLQLPFNNQDLAVPPGQTASQVTESWTQGDQARLGDGDEGWWPGTPAASADKGLALWTRTTRVRQYSIADLQDGRLDDPLDGATEPIHVHLKEVEVVLASPKQGGALPPGRPLTLRVIKPF